jgi:hypothetical protein
MIVTQVGSTCEARGPRGRASWRCLARRGMLHSECESVDYLALDPGSAITLPGPGRTESAWFILAGSGQLRSAGPSGTGRRTRILKPDQLVLLPAGGRAHVSSGPDGLAMLLLSVMPEDVSRALPARRPVT